MLLSKHRYSWAEISEMMHRSHGAIARRCRDLGIKDRPVAMELTGKRGTWSSEDFEILADGIRHGDSYAAIGKAVGRSEKCVRSKVYNDYLTENADKVREMLGDGAWGTGTPEMDVRHGFYISRTRQQVRRDLSVLDALLRKRMNDLGYDPYWQRFMHLAPGMFAPDNIPTVTPEASAPVETDKNKPEVTGDEGGISMTKEELRAKYPDEIAQVEADARASVDHTEAVNTAIQAERARMQEIDEISGLLDATDVQQAKYGDKPCSAADLLMAAAKNAAKQGKKFLADLKDDGEESGASGVPAAPAPAVETPEGEDGEKNDTPEARMTNARSMVADLLGKKKEG